MTCFTENYSQAYDAFYGDKEYARETEFVLELLQKHRLHPSQNVPIKNVHGKTVLDFGCGTGRHSAELAQRGLTVIGVDRSESMLRLASLRAKKLGLTIDYFRQIPSNVDFDLVLSLFAVLNYVPPGSELRNTLNNLRSALKPDGIAIFDVWNGVAVPFFYEPNRTRTTTDPDGKVYTRKSIAELDWIRQRLDIKMQVGVGNDPIQSFTETHSMYYQTPTQFIQSLNASGLECIEILPAYRNALVSSNDYNLIYVCRRAENA